ncbi:MAG TPA: hypothetical protein VM240_13615 [Verrucomicrobiae bacterium]|nr:hypothetical protein [Verrucomicrobiae bacterium]
MPSLSKQSFLNSSRKAIGSKAPPAKISKLSSMYEDAEFFADFLLRPASAPEPARCRRKILAGALKRLWNPQGSSKQWVPKWHASASELILGLFR